MVFSGVVHYFVVPASVSALRYEYEVMEIKNRLYASRAQTDHDVCICL